MSSAEHISKLLFLYIRDQLTPGQAAELEAWRNESRANEELFLKLTDEESVRKLMQEYYYHQQRGWDKLVKMAPELDLRPVRRMRWVKGIAAAACICLVFGVAGYIWSRQGADNGIGKIGDIPKANNDIPPGNNKAKLTLSNGSAIMLDSIANGILAAEGNMAIRKTASGQLSYLENTVITNPTVPASMFNILQTPRGGQYQVMLPDGTKIWLNAASTLKYPVYFSGKERRVELTGEAYFEVAKNAVMPFIVSVNDQYEVNVLGTHFNVMAYPDEPVTTTTLLEGKVKINSRSAIHAFPAAILLPGEQARWKKDGEPAILHQIDTEEAVAWKNGVTSFKDADIKGIMRKVARWYDVDIEYRGVLQERVFGGGIPRNTNLSQLLKVLATYNIHFTVEGKKIIVTP